MPCLFCLLEQRKSNVKFHNKDVVPITIAICGSSNDQCHLQALLMVAFRYARAFTVLNAVSVLGETFMPRATFRK